MSDTTAVPPATTAAAGTETTPKRRESTGINREIAREIDLAEQLLNLSLLPEYSVALTDEGIDSTAQKALADKITQADDLISTALGEKVEKKIDTQDEEQNKKTLLAAIAVVQKRAKRKYKKADDPMREKYFLGVNLRDNRPLLETSTRAILKVLATDTLPGAKPTDSTNIQTALDAYVGVQTTQSQDSTEARKARIALEALVKEIAEARRDIQYAVDTIWPASDKANAAVRVAFKLSATKSLK